MRIVCISDTHARHDELELPEGDILVHAGDFTRRGALADIEAFDRWLASQPHRHKVVIAGNHDFAFERQPQAARSALKSGHYLEDSGVELEGLKFWGSPWQPWFFDWAFNLQRGPELAARWALIPEDTDILVTHGPPAGHGDLTSRGDRAGCVDLLERIRVVKPRLHVFGHIHEGYGQSREGSTRCVNASSLNLAYEPVHEPVVVDLASV